MRAARARLRMGMVFNGQHAIGDRQAVIDCDAHQALGAFIRDVFVMPRFATHHAPQRHQRRVSAGGREGRGGHGQFPGAGNPHEVDVGLAHTLVSHRLARAIDQRIGDARIPAAGEDGEAGASGGSHFTFD